MRARKHWMAGWMNRQKNLQTVCRTTSPNRRTDVVDSAADDESADELSEQEESLTEEETTPDLPDFIPEEEPLTLEEERTAACAGRATFVWVTPNTRVYLEIDETAGDEDDGELYDGNFVNEANVYVEQVRQDAQGRTWLLVRYLYGAEEPNGEMAWTDTATVWVLAEETQPSDAADYDVTDYAFPYHAGWRCTRPRILTRRGLQTLSGDTGEFYAGQQNGVRLVPGMTANASRLRQARRVTARFTPRQHYHGRA